MRKIIAPALFVFFALGAASSAVAQDMPPLPSTENVEKLSWLVGSFKGDDKFSMEGQEMPGTSTTMGSFILDKRFLRMEVSYDTPFGKMDGIMMLTYNNTKEKYEGFWIDNMSDYTMRAFGTMDGNSLKLVSEEIADPMMSGAKVIYHITYTKNANGTVTMSLDMKMGEEMSPLIRSEMKKG